MRIDPDTTGWTAENWAAYWRDELAETTAGYIRNGLAPDNAADAAEHSIGFRQECAKTRRVGTEKMQVSLDIDGIPSGVAPSITETFDADEFGRAIPKFIQREDTNHDNN